MPFCRLTETRGLGKLLAHNVRADLLVLTSALLGSLQHHMFRSLNTFMPANIPTLMRTILGDRFFKVASLLFVATMITHVLNFLFQVVMGRMLTPEEYGTLNALLSILMVTAIPFTTIMMLLARETSILKVGGETGAIRSLFHWSYRRLYRIAVPALFLFLLAAPLARDFLQMSSVVPVVLLGLVAFLSVSLPVNLAFLQGLQRFGLLAIANASLGPLKFSFCVLLVMLGGGVSGVLTGHILTYGVLFLISFLPLRGIFKHALKSVRTFPPLFRRAYPEFMANLCFGIMTQFDLVLVKHLFGPQLAGTYAIAAVLGRAVMYLPVALVMALFPMVAESHALHNDPKPFLWKALSYTFLLSGAGALLCWLFPYQILAFLFGAKYLDAGPLLRLYGSAMLPMALLLVVMNFSIARNENKVWRLVAWGALSEVALIGLWHSDLSQILTAVFIGGTASLILTLVPVLRSGPATSSLP